MLKKIISFFVFALLCFLLYLALKLLFSFFPADIQISNTVLSLSNAIGFGIAFTFFLFGITYGWLWTKETVRSGGKKFLLITISILFSMVIFPILILLIEDANNLYNYIVSDNVYSVIGIPYVPDDTLGLKHIPNSLGAQSIPYYGKIIPMHSSKEGFRVPVSDSTSLDANGHADVIFFGCSFTYGHGILAEEAFPYVVAKQDSLSYINAGVCSYGLSQMDILANRLIPKYKPKYVVIQYSPWLIQRSLCLFSPNGLVVLTNPYFCKNGDNISILPPVYVVQAFQDKGELREKYEGNYLSFVFKVGIPYCENNFFHIISVKIKQAWNPLLRPATDADAVEKYIYNDMVRVATENGAQVIILNLGDQEYSQRSKSLFDTKYNVRFAEADSMLSDYLEKSVTKDFRKEFGILGFNGQDSVYADPHPNAKAHKIIAKSILLKLK